MASSKRMVYIMWVSSPWSSHSLPKSCPCEMVALCFFSPFLFFCCKPLPLLSSSLLLFFSLVPGISSKIRHIDLIPGHSILFSSPKLSPSMFSSSEEVIIPPETDIDRSKCTRVVPMRVLCLGLSRTGTNCKIPTIPKTPDRSKIPWKTS